MSLLFNSSKGAKDVKLPYISCMETMRNSIDLINDKM